MTGQTKFKHITVTPGDCDEVIVAGKPDSIEDAQDVLHGDPAPDATCKDPCIDNPGDGHGSNGFNEASASDRGGSRPSRSESRSSNEPGKSKNGYRETTLEDIESSKMSVMQKAIIAIAALAIISFVAYYIFAM